jgi:hypothetical protein
MRLFLKVFAVLFVAFVATGALWFAYRAHDRPTELSIAVAPPAETITNSWPHSPAGSPMRGRA